MSAKVYFYTKNQETIGPHNGDEISELIISGTIRKNDWVRTESTDWVIAFSFGEFKDAFNKNVAQSKIIKTPSASNDGVADSSVSNSDTRKAKESILELPWINENPFRILDLPVTATKKEIERSLTKSKAFAKIGKPIVPKSDYGLPFSPEVNLDLLDQAKSDIDQPERRIRSSIFWFWDGSAIDKMAFEAIEKNDETRACEIWDKVCSDKAVTKSNFSSVRNLSLYRLANAGNEGTLCEKSLKDSLSLAGKFFSSEYLQTFLDSLPVEQKNNLEKHYHAKDFANQVVNSLSQFLDKSNITLNKFIEYFEHFPKVAIDSVKSKFTQKEIAQVEEEVEKANSTSSSDPSDALKSRRTLLNKTKSNLKLLGEILGKDDLKYKGLCNEVAWEVRQSSMRFFNYARETSPPFDPGDDCLELVTEALTLYSEGRTGKELRKDKEFLEDWIENKDQRENNKKGVALADAIRASIEKAEKTGTLQAARILVTTCIPKIEETKKLLGNDIYLKASDWVASSAIGICVECCNASSGSATIYQDAVKVMTAIGQLDMTSEVRSYYTRNKEILVANAHAANQSLNNSSSGCYIATMVYGSYDSPEVLALRNFRDQNLIPYASGRFFVKIYYFLSPVFVRLTKDIQFIHYPIRFILNKIIKCISSKTR